MSPRTRVLLLRALVCVGAWLCVCIVVGGLNAILMPQFDVREHVRSMLVSTVGLGVLAGIAVGTYELLKRIK
jgi:hypothetical protein